MQPRIGTSAHIDPAQVFDVANNEIAARRRGTAYRRRSCCFTNYDRKSRRLGGSVGLPCHELNAPITGPSKSEMGHVNAPHLSSFIVNMAATIGVTMNRFSRNRVCHRPKRRIGFGLVVSGREMSSSGRDTKCRTDNPADPGSKGKDLTRVRPERSRYS
jgi:hypothetical protein